MSPIWTPGAPPLCAWLGDDFTGAAAVLEVLAFAGLPAALFLKPPNTAQRAALGDLAAVGLASTARARGPEWMTQHLPSAYRWLAQMKPELCVYKICSTLDSAPHVGSIGRAVELAQDVFGSAPVPCVVSAPTMGRFQAFGTLFASGPDGHIHRLDRHPVMQRHPSTPMDEADVARHLSRQTHLSCQVLTLPDLKIDARLPTGIVAIDAVDPEDLVTVGRLVWEGRHAAPFAIGSQGLQMALVAWWRERSQLPRRNAVGTITPRDSIVISGSLSRTTALQIAHAEANGHRTIRLDVGQLLQGDAEKVASAAADEAANAVRDGATPLLATALGPDDPAQAAFAEATNALALDPEAAAERLGRGLGTILAAVLDRTGRRRALVAGGDTSGHIMETLGGFALTGIVPGPQDGCALFRMHADGALDGLEVMLKGGQMGPPGIFSTMGG